MLIPALLAAASATAASKAPISAAETRAAVDRLADKLETEYPIAAVATWYATALRANLGSGRYSGLHACDLAKRMDDDLQAVVHKDLHLHVSCDRATPDEKPGRQNPIDIAQPLTNVPVFYIGSTGGWVLTEEACQEVIAAMSLAGGAKYVIVDIRDNPGGAGIIGNLIASYFYPLEDGHVLVRGAFRDRRQDTLEGTYPYVPGPRLPDAKVFILVNAHTGSAAEGFAFGLQHAGRAIVVGQTTAGAGIAAWPFDLGDGLSASIPRKLILAPDGSPGWEGVGVKPDIPTEPGKEVDAARAVIEAELAGRAH